MHTNGRCTCLDGMRPDRRIKLRRSIDRDRKRITELEQRLAAASGDGLP